MLLCPWGRRVSKSNQSNSTQPPLASGAAEDCFQDCSPCVEMYPWHRSCVFTRTLCSTNVTAQCDAWFSALYKYSTYLLTYQLKVTKVVIGCGLHHVDPPAKNTGISRTAKFCIYFMGPRCGTVCRLHSALCTALRLRAYLFERWWTPSVADVAFQCFLRHLQTRLGNRIIIICDKK